MAKATEASDLNQDAAQARIVKAVFDFLQEFGRTDHRVIRCLAHLAEVYNFENFGIFVEKLSADILADKLEKIAKLNKNPELKKMMNNYRGNIIPSRNKLLHSQFIVQKEDLVLTTIGRWEASKPSSVRPNNIAAPRLSVATLNRHTNELRCLSTALDQLAEETFQGPR
jgi:hypothetical protein